MMTHTSTRESRKVRNRTGFHLVALLAIGLISSHRILGQADGSSAKSETLVLSPFTVNDDSVGRYSATQATSGGRVAVNLFDAIQNISVVTRDVLDDVSATRLLDALKYTSGVTESTIPNGVDRVTIRGFQSDGSRVDNFSTYIDANLDPVFVYRIEVVKGPDAILAPSGVPGGTINVVSRKPLFSGDGGYASAQVGLFDAQRFEFDDNVVGLGGAAAFRVVGAFQDTRGYVGEKQKRYAFMPMVSFRTKSGAELTLQFQYNDARFENYFGLPIDQSSGTNNTATLIAGVNRFTNIYQGDYRAERRPEYRAFLTVPFSEEFSMRLSGRFADVYTVITQNLPSVSSANYGGATNPLDGNYYPGESFGGAPTFAVKPATPEPSTLNRSGTSPSDRNTYFDVQNDFLWTLKGKFATFSSVAGYWISYYRDKDITYYTSANPVNFAALAPEVVTFGSLASKFTSTSYQDQVYLSENVSLLDGKVTLNGSYAYDVYNSSYNDALYNATYSVNLEKTLKSVGAVVKPLPWIDAFYNYSQNSTPQNAQGIVQYGNKPFQDGVQNEYGLRFNALKNRLYITADYFDVMQNNYSIPNPNNYVTPPPVPLLPALFSDRKAKGWELEFEYVVTPELSLVGNATKFTNRDPHDVPFRDTAEESWGVLANYRFSKQSAFSGLSLVLGIDYLSKRPGDAASGVTAASTSAAIIPNQPTFYLPARTLVNPAVGYVINKHWKTQVNIDNLFNTNYLEASINRFVVVPGAPINARGTVTYSF